ncbi:deSI-like protein [Pyrus ussuriensis x Pyrus communis]|uniref:DeSI-like protein n=1 Tax=Pyrus ussuriensis x Pyrus communis TaxID=2448454 RepID=A0A5N5GG00_9ROSA|nr:deSI-like protein [Pyrus ussuriensis x Pyrus communis]
MLCKKSVCRSAIEEEDSGSVPVYLNVYDLSPFNGYAYWLGLGVYHSGVQACIWKGNTYNLVTKSSNHFCNDACITLTGNPIPSWVNRLTRIGFLCNCVLPATLKNLAKVHRIEDKADEGDKNKLTSQSNNVAISSNSPSSSSSSPSGTTLRRGRSRTRRPRPLSSPLIIASSSF